jgi:Fe-S-cluster containining protein
MLEKFQDTAVVIPQLDDNQSRPLMAKMARILKQINAMGEMRKFRSQLKLPAMARRLSKQGLVLYDNYLAYTIRQLEKKGWQAYCGSGCAACCYAMPAGISSWELVLIYDYLQQGGQLEKYFRRNLESCQVLSQVRLQLGKRSSEGESSGGSDTGEILKAYSLARHPCGFLSDSQECMIYPIRPLACRMHYSFTPPEWCDPTHPNSSQAVRLNLGPHAEVQEELKHLDGHLGLDIGDFLSPGLVALATNIMRFSPLNWT